MKKIFVIFFAMCSLQLVSLDINWSTLPIALSTVGTNASDPQIAMDSNGNVVAIWVEDGLVKSKSKPINMNWSSIHTLSGTGGSSPRTVIDSNGNATAIWVESGIVKAASKSLSGSWSSSVTVSASGAASPSLAVDSAGDVIAVWTRNGGIQTSTKLFGGNWQTVATISGASSAFPHIALGGSGSNKTAVVVWQDIASGTNVVYVSSKLISGSWITKQIISDTLHQAGYAHAAVNANGDATAVWYSYNVSGINYSRVIVQSACKLFGGTWSGFSDLSASGMRNPATLSAKVAYDGSGNAIALWNQSFDNETFNIQSSIKSVYSNWTAPLNLVVSNLYSYQADLAVASIGDALALYMFYNGNDLLIQSSELDISGFMNAGWSVPIILSPGNENAYPLTAAVLTGNVINTAAIWISSDGVSNSILASTGVKFLVLPPSNLHVTQCARSFGVFVEYYNTISWDASSDPQVAGYLIYRNGVFLKRVSSDVLQAIDDNKVQNGAVTYGVAAVDSQNSHSRIINVSFP